MTSDKKIIAFIVSLALFMEALDATIINTAIPAMARSLHVYPVDLKIALISYLISLAIFIPISGWAADKFGVKRVFIAALGIFTFASMWCGYAQTLSELVIARCIQGLSQSFGVTAAALLLHHYAINSHSAAGLTPTVFHNTFFAMGLITFLSTFVFIRLKANDGHQMLNAPNKI